MHARDLARHKIMTLSHPVRRFLSARNSQLIAFEQNAVLLYRLCDNTTSQSIYIYWSFNNWKI